MTTEEEAEFNLICKTHDVGPALYLRLVDFISDVSSNAYQRGIDAESYASAMPSMGD